jgi:hypothetical protein
VARIRIVDGSLSMVVDDQIDELVRNAVERVAPGLVDFIEGEIEPIYEEAKRQWPVGPDRRFRNGRHSRDELYSEIVIDGDTIRGRIWNTAPWAKYIRPKGLKGKSAFVVLLRTPLKRREKHIVAGLGRYVSATIGGERG